MSKTADRKAIVDGAIAEREAARREAEICDRLWTLASKIRHEEAVLASLYQARADLWRDGRSRTPKMTLQRLAAASKVTTATVIRVLGKGT